MGPVGNAIALLIVAVGAGLWVRATVANSRWRALFPLEDRTPEGHRAALKDVDRDTPPEVLLARAQDVMRKVNDAWCAGDMGPARRYLSDGVYERLRAQLAINRRWEQRNTMADWRPLGARLAGVDSDALWDTVHIALSAVARDAMGPADESPEAALARARKAPKKRYEEVWSFVRRRGAIRKGVTLHGHCPSCRAVLPPGSVLRCPRCGSLANSGEHDWVLADLSQVADWRPTPRQRPNPAPEMVAQDPNISPRAIEDRAAVLFWNWAEACATGSRERLDRLVLHPGRPKAPPQPLTDVLARRIRVKRVVREADGHDRVTVSIKWSSRHHWGDPVTWTSKLVMARKHGVLTRPGLSNPDCLACGGGLDESDGQAFLICTCARVGGEDDWALEDLS